jgi:hypothetical protein
MRVRLTLDYATGIQEISTMLGIRIQHFICMIVEHFQHIDKMMAAYLNQKMK